MASQRQEASGRIHLLLLRDELLQQEADITERIAAVSAASKAVDKLLATPKMLEGAERSPLAPLFSSEGVGL